MIQVRGLRKAFGTTIAVDGVSFEIARGETFGLLGPNGAGKTTTIHMLVGVLRPDAGVVSLAGVSDPTRLTVEIARIETVDVLRRKSNRGELLGKSDPVGTSVSPRR